MPNLQGGLRLEESLLFYFFIIFFIRERKTEAA